MMKVVGLLGAAMIWALVGCETDRATLTSPAAMPGDRVTVDRASGTWNLIQLSHDSRYTRSEPIAITNAYLLLGQSFDAAGASHYFTQRLGQERRYFGPDFLATAINDYGTIVGSHRGKPAFWDASGRVTYVPGVVTGSALDISESGWIIGQGMMANGIKRSFNWRPGWDRVRFLEEVFPPSTLTRVVSVNNEGFVAGEVDGYLGIWSPNGSFSRIDLPDTIYSFSARAAEISDAGHVVGHLTVIDTLQGGGVIAGFLWMRGRPLTVIMGSPRHWRVQLYATDIDRHGRVFGSLRSDLIHYPIVWAAGTLMGLPTAQYGTRVIDANDCGVAVGFGMLFGGPPGVQHLWLTEC
jgi:hypothetical protein